MKRFNFVFMLMMLCANQSYAACNAETGKDDDGDYCGSWDCGAAGSNVTCTLSKGTLTISGEGEMKDYYYTGSGQIYPRAFKTDAPWGGKYVTKAVIDGNITKIGNSTFLGESYLTEISGTESLKTIGSWGFEYSGIKSIDIPNVTHLGAGAFYNASSLQYVNMRDDVKVSGVFVGVPAINGNMNNCAIANGYMICGSCGDKFVQAGVGCVSSCYTGYTSYYGFCTRTRYTLPEADAATSNDNENTIEWIFE